MPMDGNYEILVTTTMNVITMIDAKYYDLIVCNLPGNTHNRLISIICYANLVEYILEIVV